MTDTPSKKHHRIRSLDATIAKCGTPSMEAPMVDADLISRKRRGAAVDEARAFMGLGRTIEGMLYPLNSVDRVEAIKIIKMLMERTHRQGIIDCAKWAGLELPPTPPISTGACRADDTARMEGAD